MWTKYPEAVMIESADWSEILNGDTITGDVEITPVGTLTGFSAVVLDTVDNISRIRLSGGAAGESGYLLATINTTGGQKLLPSQPVFIKRRPFSGLED